MSGYTWAKTPEGDLFVVLMVAGKGYVPGVEGAISLDEIFFLEPVAWPTAITPQSQNSAVPRLGAPAVVAMPECVILPFAANG